MARDAGHDPDFRLSRRAFFRALVLEARDLSSALEGKRTYPLAGLGRLSIEELASLRPSLRRGLAVVVDGDRLVARQAEGNTCLDLAPATRENVLVLNLFGSGVTLGTAARRLALQMEWPEAEAMAHVRALFLDLVDRLVYLPRNAPERE